MGFVKNVAPKVIIAGWTIRFTEAGALALAQVAPELDAAHSVHLWHDRAAGEIAVTPAPPDRDSFALGKWKRIDAASFFTWAKLGEISRLEIVALDAHENGVRFRYAAGRKAAIRRPPPRVRKMPADYERGLRVMERILDA